MQYTNIFCPAYCKIIIVIIIIIIIIIIITSSFLLQMLFCVTLTSFKRLPRRGKLEVSLRDEA